MELGTVLRASEVTKKFRSGQTELTVLDRLDVEIERGELVAITGESGSGKSTLLHILGTLDTPTSGEVYFSNRAFSQFAWSEITDFRNREIGFVWQFHYLLPEFTALENVTMPLRVRGAPVREAVERGRAVLAEVGLAERSGHRPGELSGGEQQRVALARALVGQPSLFLADEPTGNLDPRTGEMVFRLIEQLHRAYRLTSILVTHNLSFARRCTRVLQLEGGRLHPMDRDFSPVPPD